MKVVTLIPWRDSGDDRRRLLWDWTKPFLEELGYPLYTGPGPDGPFNRSAAINQAARAAGDWDIALIGDSDTIQQAGPVEEAIHLIANEGRNLVFPWTYRIKLSPGGTDLIARRGTGWVNELHRDPNDRTANHGGGGTLVVSRRAFDAVKGFDERFVGYGNEDLAFTAAIETLVIGNGAERIGGMIWHMYHKTQPYVGTVAAATPSNQALWDRYARVRWNPDGMKQLIKR